MGNKRNTAGGGGKLARSKMVSVRLDPELHYLTELAARSQRKTVSAFIEWSIEQALRNVRLPDSRFSSATDSPTVAEQASELWHVNDAERFFTLALTNPGLLTYDEQVLWDLIEGSGLLSGAIEVAPNGRKRWNRKKLYKAVLPLLKEHWIEYVTASRKEMVDKELPSWKWENQTIKRI